MSAFVNPKYGPPPTAAQMGLVNGIVPSAGAQQYPANQQQHPQQQQLQMQQQQQVLQQKQHQQHIPQFPSNMSKFMPPSTSYNALNVNGPSHGAPLTAMQQPHMTTNNLPPHLRSSAANGPSGMPLTNGGAGTPSSNSSRTASPALQALSTQGQLQQQPLTLSNAKTHLHPATIATSMASAKILPPPPTSAPSDTAGLTASMQNINLSRVNGAQTSVSSMPQMSIPPQAQQQRQVQSNFQANFKTSALNTGSSSQLPLPANAQPPHNSAFSNHQSTTSGVKPPELPPPPQANDPATSVEQPFSQAHPQHLPPPPPSMFTQNANYSATIRRNMPPNAPSLPQNNNSNPQPQLFSAQPQPMYPLSSHLPPSLPQQQYQSAPHTHPDQLMNSNAPTSPVFNGQPNVGSLQYQSQSSPAYPGMPTLRNPQMNVVQQGYNRLWGQDTIDLMQNRHILTSSTLQRPKIVLHNQLHEAINCNPNIIRCTIAKIPESNSLLQKSRLPLGILIHPFRDVNSLPVIQCPNIVRCRLCRTYINPFVYFVDSKMWKCNLCYRVNELPDDFQFDPATKTYGDVTRRPEVRSSTIEFIAPSEYMLRPPQPAIYLFLFDVSIIAQQSGYLENVCETLNKHIDDMPGDARTQVGFIAYNSQVHFYALADGYNQPHEMTLIDIDDPFLPRPDNLLVNLKECKELIKDLLTQLPKRFADTHDPGSALGAALQVGYKLMQASGGRITVFQTCLPNTGPGSLEPREDPNNRSAKDVAHLNPATDFYKRYALDCSGYQIAVDLFLLNQQYSDMATISGISKHSGGCVHHFPLYQKTRAHQVDALRQCLKRYLVRKIGFEAVMRIRCTRGLQVHTFHGNFFVRSTDLLSLPNVNPDAGYGMQIAYEESLTDVKTICFQAALLYTNSEGERRIRVHTLCLPVTASLPEIMHAADTEAIVGLLSKMAVDRSLSANMVDAREAFINATVDVLSAFKIAQNLPAGQTGQLIAPRSLALLPMYILALLKHPAFRIGTSTRLDDRVYAMDCMKSLPLDQLIRYIYPEFYNIDALFYTTHNSNANATEDDEEEDDLLPEIPRLQLSAEYLDSRSIFLMDCGVLIMLYVGLNVPVNILESVLGVKSTAELPDYYYGIPQVDSVENDNLRRFIMKLNDDKPYQPILQIIRDTSTAKPQFIEKLIDDRSESSLSYYEFLQHIRTQVK